MHRYRTAEGFGGDFKGWSFPAGGRAIKLDTTIPPFFQKILPLDERYLLLIGGNYSPNFFDPVADVPESSLYLIALDPRPHETKIVDSKQLKGSYALHSAVAHYKKKQLYIAGGQLGGKWTTKFTSIDLDKPFSQCPECEFPDLSAPLFGPSMVIPDSATEDPTTIYVGGANLTTGATVIFRYLSAKQKWETFEADYFSDNNINLGFMAMAVYPGDPNSLLIFGGISPDGKTKSDSARRIEGGGCTSEVPSLIDKMRKPSPDYFLDNQRVDTYQDKKVKSFTFLGVNQIYQVNFDP